MVWEEVDNDYRVGTIRGGNGRGDTHTRTHWRRVLGKDGREEKRRKVDGSNKERGK